MPELPEVETICRGLREAIDPHTKIQSVQIMRRDLRVPIQRQLESWLKGQKILSIRRRAKYLLFDTAEKTVISHLGMSGAWRIVNNDRRTHDHCYITFENGQCLAFFDPRRFGLILCVNQGEENKSSWIKHLGVEPLSLDLTSAYLRSKSNNKKVSIKNYLMDQKIVVGIGNIYASEILFKANIRPTKSVDKIALRDWEVLIPSIQNVLNHAVDSKGTTLKDYHQASGEKGGFQNELFVYGRAGQPCRICKSKIVSKVITARSTYWCTKCQK